MNGNYRLEAQDRLVSVWVSPEGKRVRKGKRVGTWCPLTREEVRAFVEKGGIAAVRLIRSNRECSLSEAWNLLNEARGADQLTRIQTNLPNTGW